MKLPHARRAEQQGCRASLLDAVAVVHRAVHTLADAQAHALGEDAVEQQAAEHARPLLGAKVRLHLMRRQHPSVQSITHELVVRGLLLVVCEPAREDPIQIRLGAEEMRCDHKRRERRPIAPITVALVELRAGSEQRVRGELRHEVTVRLPSSLRIGSGPNPMNRRVLADGLDDHRDVW